MNQKKKWIIICVFAFLLLAGVLLVKGMQKTNTNKINTASENISNHLVTGQAVSSSAVIKEESVKKKSKTSGQNKKNTEKKDKKIKAEQKKETTKSPQKTPKKPKATPSIKPAKEPKITPTASPTKKPVEPKKTVTFSIHCKEILEHKDLWKEGIEEIIPKDGSFFNGTVEFTQGETVYDILKRICAENHIALDCVFTPLYGTYYIKGMGNLYEFDCGSESGWKYSVNGELPGTGSSDYVVKVGDKIEFYYECVYKGEW